MYYSLKTKYSCLKILAKKKKEKKKLTHYQTNVTNNLKALANTDYKEVSSCLDYSDTNFRLDIVKKINSTKHSKIM